MLPDPLVFQKSRPQGPPGMPGVWYGGLRVMALDGSTLNMPDEHANAAHFGYPGASRGSSAFPQLHFVALAECGTHTLCYANQGPCRSSERALAEPVIDRADASMLVTADRNFYSYAFWQRSCATGAKLVFRVKSNLRLPREQELADGSYLTTLIWIDLSTFAVWCPLFAVVVFCLLVHMGSVQGPGAVYDGGSL